MSGADELMGSWYAFTAEATGKLIPPNAIAVKGDIGVLQYEVPDGAPLLRIVGEDNPTRVLTMTYDLEDFKNEPRC